MHTRTYETALRQNDVKVESIRFVSPCGLYSAVRVLDHSVSRAIEWWSCLSTPITRGIGDSITFVTSCISQLLPSIPDAIYCLSWIGTSLPVA